VVGSLPSKHKALCSNSDSTKKNIHRHSLGQDESDCIQKGGALVFPSYLARVRFAIWDCFRLTRAMYFRLQICLFPSSSWVSFPSVLLPARQLSMDNPQSRTGLCLTLIYANGVATGILIESREDLSL
jgi:hypothetical protein